MSNCILSRLQAGPWGWGYKRAKTILSPLGYLLTGALRMYSKCASQSNWGVSKVRLFFSICVFLLKKKKEKEKRTPPFQHPMSTGPGAGAARARPLGEGVRVEGNGIDTVVHGEDVPDVPGPEAGTAQGGGVPQLHQREAGEGVLSLDLSALGQRQKETYSGERTQRTG